MDLDSLICAALAEDMPTGDLTTDSLGITKRIGNARLVAKEDLVLSGVVPFEKTILQLDPEAELAWHFNDGDLVLKRQTICSLHCNLIQLLKAERTALNFIGPLSGIATITRVYCQQLTQTQTKLLDTRKTTPGLRALQKQAVAHGGGTNHRLNLSSAVMLKDNHISLMGGITAAVTAVRKTTEVPIIVEARTLEDVKEACALNVDQILLDNMNNDLLKSALDIIPSRIKSEASGNMTLERIRSVAELGVTYISVGAITHSAPTADISLLFDWD